jgi:hypothetical protein
MAISIQKETLIPFREIPNWCEKNLGDRIHPSTAVRWRLRGARGVKLESILAGGQRYTSHEALLRFFNGATAAADATLIPRLEVGLDQRQIQASERFLDSEGI